MLNLPHIWRKAALVLHQRGLAYGELQNTQGNVCLWGAINVAMYGDANHQVQMSYAVTLALMPFCNGEHPVDWSNNYGRRTVTEVVTMLHTAADTVEQWQKRQSVLNAIRYESVPTATTRTSVRVMERMSAV